MRRVVVGHHDVSDPPFDRICGQYRSPLADHLVGDDQAFGSGQGRKKRRLAAGGRAQVEYPGSGVRLENLPENCFEEHRTGFLDVIGAAVERRVERELRAFVEVVAVTAPRNLPAFGLRPDFVGVETDADRRFAVVQRGEQSFRFGSPERLRRPAAKKFGQRQGHSFSVFLNDPIRNTRSSSDDGSAIKSVWSTSIVRISPS